MKLPRLALPLSVALLCLASYVPLPVTGNDAGEAAPTSAEADDDAGTLEGRREALRKLEESAALLSSAGEKLEAARVLNRAGRLRLILNAPEEAIQSHRKALNLLEESPSSEAEVDALNGVGAAYMHLNKKTEARESLDKALSLSQQSGYVRGQAEALLTLSDAENFSDHAAAVRTAQKALNLWQILGDKRGLARAHSYIGRYYFAQNSLSESAQNYLQAMALWRELDDVPEQAEALIMLGFIEYRKGEWENDIQFLTQAQALLDETAEPAMTGQIASGLAEAFNEIGLPDNALVQYERALHYFRQTQSPILVTHAIWGLGVTHYLLGNHEEAVRFFQQVLDSTDADGLYSAQCNEYLGRIHSARGEHATARRELESALAIYTKAVNPMEAARVRALLGQLAERQGQIEQARQFYRGALKSFTELSDRINQAAVHYALGRLELKNKHYELAEEYLRRSVEVTEEMRGVGRSSDLTAAFSATTYERYEKYIECLMRQHEAHPSGGFAARAFEMSELARARSLWEMLGAGQTILAPGMDRELAEQEKSLRQSLRLKEDSKIALLGRAYRKEELGALDRELARLHADYRRITDIIRARYPSYEQLARPRARDLRRVQEEVVSDDQTLLLEYTLGEDRSYVWAVTRAGFASYELPSHAAIKAVVQKVYKLLATPPGAEEAQAIRDALGELTRMVLSPVSAEMKKHRIIVVADGALNYIPFQVLPMPSGDEPLVAAYEVVNAPSATVIGELRQEAARRQPATKLLAAFGNPVFASNYGLRKAARDHVEIASAQTSGLEHWPRALRDIELNRDTFDPSVIKPLFYARRELAHLIDAADDGAVFVAEDFAATRERLLKMDFTDYAILHLATHGLLDPKRPENSGLVLSTVNEEGREQDGFVGLQQIYGMRARVSLVVLSACQTGLGKDVRGEGLLGLTRGFMYAGASSVVASLWKVDDEATAELMKQFYNNMLREKMPPAAALRAAQNSIRQRPEWRSPYYWGAFTLQGEYLQVIRPTQKESVSGLSWRYVAGGALLMLMGCAWSYRRRKLRTL